MEGTKIADYIEANLEVFRLVAVGKISASALNQFSIYKRYLTLCYLPSKMERYRLTSELMGVGETTVRDAVREMEKNL